MQSVFNGSNLHEMSILFSGKNKKNNKVFECCEVIICCINPETGKGQHKQTKMITAAFSLGPQNLGNRANIDQPSACIMRQCLGCDISLHSK